MNSQQIQEQLRQYHEEGLRIFASSSFQTQSLPLLHIISQSKVPVDILFINTGFHFPETLRFRDEIADVLSLRLIDVRSFIPMSQQRDELGQLYYVSDPDHCCYLNKTQPMEPYLMQYDIWISGVRKDQSKVRSAMERTQPAPFNTTRFHPMLEWSAKEVYEYRMRHGLPEHPLDEQGYQSIGCAPCTRKLLEMDERSARWFGMNKTECGLHTDLISK